MEGAVKRDHCRAAGGATHDLQRIFRRFRAAVGEHAADRVVHRDKCGKTIHQLDVGRVRCGIKRIVGQPGRLVANRLDHTGMAVAEVEHTNAADKIDIAFARGVPDLSVFTVAEADGVNDGNRLANGFVAHESGTRQWRACFYLSRAPALVANEIKSPGHD